MASMMTSKPVTTFPCVTCGYDLQGTALGGVCPECGTKVAATVGRSEYHLDGNRLVVTDRTTLPEYCVKTGMRPEETEGRSIEKTITWIHPAIYLLLLVNIIILLIVYLAAKKPCRVRYFISREAKRVIFRKQMIGLGIFLFGITCLIGTFILMDNYRSMPDEAAVGLVVGSILVGLFGLGVIAVYQNHVSIKQHKDGQFWLGGLSPEFIARVRADSEGH